MEYLTFISIALCFIIVINRIRKQDRYLKSRLAVIEKDIQNLKTVTGLSVHSVDYETGEVVEENGNNIANRLFKRIDNSNADR